jgi:hypothetical protein
MNAAGCFHLETYDTWEEKRDDDNNKKGDPNGAHPFPRGSGYEKGGVTLQ